MDSAHQEGVKENSDYHPDDAEKKFGDGASWVVAVSNSDQGLQSPVSRIHVMVEQRIINLGFLGDPGLRRKIVELRDKEPKAGDFMNEAYACGNNH